MNIFKDMLASCGDDGMYIPPWMIRCIIEYINDKKDDTFLCGIAVDILESKIDDGIHLSKRLVKFFADYIEATENGKTLVDTFGTENLMAYASDFIELIGMDNIKKIYARYNEKGNFAMNIVNHLTGTKKRETPTVSTEHEDWELLRDQIVLRALDRIGISCESTVKDTLVNISQDRHRKILQSVESLVLLPDIPKSWTMTVTNGSLNTIENIIGTHDEATTRAYDRLCTIAECRFPESVVRTNDLEYTLRIGNLSISVRED